MMSNVVIYFAMQELAFCVVFSSKEIIPLVKMEAIYIYSPYVEDPNRCNGEHKCT